MTPLACVEVGGSGCQTVLFDGESLRVLEGAHRPPAAELAIAVPGLIDGRRVVAASNLDWYDVDPAEQLGLPGPTVLVLNDAEAAALGEAALRSTGGPTPDLVFLGLGTGIGGAVVEEGQVAKANLFGHAPGFSALMCRCGRVGCLETVASGWALPAEIGAEQLHVVAAALASAVESEPTATPALVVVAGGMAAAHPDLVDALQVLLPARRVERSAAPAHAKSASAWGLQHAVERLARAQ